MFYCYAHNWTNNHLPCPLCQPPTVTTVTTNAGTENFFEPTAWFTHDQCQIKYESLLAQAENLEAALLNCRMQFSDMMRRRKAPDAWMIQELDEALAEFEKWKDGK